jgi:hypothetical protein
MEKMGYTYGMKNPGSNAADADNVQALRMITGEDNGPARRAGGE